MDKVL